MKIARIALLSLAACSGTDTGNPPVIDFGNSGCHDQSYDKGLILQSLDQPMPDPRYKGLTCIAYQHDGSVLQVQISNYDAGCGADIGWTPHAELREDGGLDLILEDHDCKAAGCGLCLYDLSFTVQLAQAPQGELRLYQRGCDGARDEKRVTLSQANAVACAYISSNALLWKGRDNGGERMLCDVDRCQSGLTCTALPSDGSRCLRDCTRDDQCDALSSCVANVCQLSATGLSKAAP